MERSLLTYIFVEGAISDCLEVAAGKDRDALLSMRDFHKKVGFLTRRQWASLMRYREKRFGKAA